MRQPRRSGWDPEQPPAGRYCCQRVRYGGHEAWMQNTVSGWTLVAHGITRYEDGTIEWDYSTGGGFNDAKLKEYKELTSETARCTIRTRQLSMVNALLCCMI